MWQPDRQQWVVIGLTFVMAGIIWLDAVSSREASIRIIVLILVAAMVWYFQGRRKQ